MPGNVSLLYFHTTREPTCVVGGYGGPGIVWLLLDAIADYDMDSQPDQAQEAVMSSRIERRSRCEECQKEV